MTASSRRLLLVQLYSPLQPADAEPLSVATLASAVQDLTEVEVRTVNPVTDPRAVSDFVAYVRRERHELVGLSVPQGTYDTALEIIELLRALRSARGHPEVLLGHALPTHLPERFLGVDPDVLIIRGWGENALRAYLSGQPRHRLADVVFMERGELVRTPARSDGQPVYPPPLRVGGDYFRRVEASRGCQFGRCTFCTRPPGRADEWSATARERIAADLSALAVMGVRRFTFTDEDFQPGAGLAALVRDHGPFTYTVSMRVDTLMGRQGDRQGMRTSEAELADLYDSGLRQVYLGVETLSGSQIRRFGKRATADHSISAVRRLVRRGFDVEIGLILFDPLVTLEELAESVDLMLSSGLWRHAGAPFGKLRIQVDSPMARSRRLAPMLTTMDPNMMAYSWDYADPRVARARQMGLEWWSGLDQAYQLIRNVVRTGRDRPDLLRVATSALLMLRASSFQVLRLAIESIRRGGTGLETGTVTSLIERRERALSAVNAAFGEGPDRVATGRLVEEIHKIAMKERIDGL
ncbi:cobalamin-dependent protein [Nonomuraea sp. B10E15]|uniref:B12-binding domain-containing radical SAM protein n=1 Tax=Nonomuraea sp. B10E15 TaxID=3153560 RepID=UPI00325C93C9